MKRALWIVGGVLLFVLVALAVAPLLFKDKIKAKIDAEIAASVNAKVYYDASSLSLSFFRRFPNLSVSLERFGVVGIGAFAGDTLADVGRFGATVNVGSLLGGGKIEVVSVELDRPRINAIRLADGRANWDIAKQDTTAQDTAAQEPTQFAVAIRRWAITDGQVFFADGQTPMALIVRGLNHSGSGDFTQDIFDLETETEAQAVTFELDSATYLAGKRVRAKLAAQIDQPRSRYTLRQSEFYLNDMGLGLDGWVQPAAAYTDADLTFKSLNGNFKDLLSLVPGMYTKSFEGLKAEGTFSLAGLVKGRYQDSLLPRLALDLKVDQGQFQYPDLPTAVTGVQVDLNVAHSPGPLENLAVNLRRFELKMGKNPVQAKAQIRGLREMQVDATVAARLNLAEVTKAFPMEGLDLRGLLAINAQAKGIYSQARKRLPAVNGEVNLVDGYVKSAQFPAPIEGLTMQAYMQNGTGRMEDTRIRIPNLALRLEGEPFTANALIEDLVNYRWDVNAQGVLDLAKMTKIYPIEGTQLAGRLQADIHTRGTMADVEAGRYDRLPTSGTLGLTGLSYRSQALPQGVSAQAIDVRFTPAAINLTRFSGKLGRSAVEMSGSLSNYFGYVLKGQTIKGQLNFASPSFDANEWMTDEPAPAQPAPEPALEPIAVPRNLDLVLTTRIAKLRYDNLDATDVTGQVVVKDGVADLRNLRMGALGGQLLVDGSYDSRDVANPAYALTLDMQGVDMPAVYRSFNTVRVLAPAAEGLQGKLTTRMNLAGKLDNKMKPVFSTLNGGGNVRIDGAQLKSIGLISRLNGLAKLNLPTESNMKSLAAQGEIIAGRLTFKPFDLTVGGQKLTLGGSSGFDQTIDWQLATNLPPTAVSQASAAIPALAKLTGGNAAVPVTFAVTGTQGSPRVQFASIGKLGGSGGVAGAVKDRAKEQLDQAKQQAEQRARDEADRLRREAEDRARAEAERVKQEAQNRAQQELDKLKDKFKKPW